MESEIREHPISIRNTQHISNREGQDFRATLFKHVSKIRTEPTNRFTLQQPNQANPDKMSTPTNNITKVRKRQKVLCRSKTENGEIRRDAQAPMSALEQDKRQTQGGRDGTTQGPT